MKRWTSLGHVDTINEEEDYMDHSSSFSSSSSSLSPSPQPRISLSSPSMELESRVNKWSLVHNSKPDALVHVGGTRFHLHKDLLSRSSGYLKRHLTDVDELTLSPPLNITAETFSLVTAFCYGAHIELTPFNVVSLRVAVELLLMIRDNLKNLTESYLRRVVFVNANYISIVLRSCLALLPESETAAFLVGRCIEALTEIGDGDSVNEFLEQAVILPAGNFVVVADAVQQHFPRHDLLYRVVDAYVKEHNGEITEEEKVEICNSIDCDKLSPPLLLHAVQNPKMPLRFIVRAMLQEQNNTRRSIIAAADSVATTGAPAGHRHREDSSATLESLLQRDTAARQNYRLRAAMDSTSSRIKSLEKELEEMKKLISKESQRIMESNSRSVMDSARSASFHCVHRTSNNVNKMQRGERGSVSLLSTTFLRGGTSPPPQHRREKSLGKRLINGLKNAFSSSSPKQGAKKNANTVDEIYDGLEAVESFQDKGKLKQFEEQVKNDEQVAQDLQNRFNKMAYEESPGLLHVLDDKDEQLAKTVKSSKEKRRSKQLEEQVKKDELVAQDLQNRFNKRAFEESHDNAVLDELANTVKSFKEKRKSKQFEEQVKSDEQVAQDLQNLLSEMPYKESAGLHDNSVLGNEGEQFPKTVGRSLKVKGKEKILEDEQVKKDEELALVLQESLNMVEPPPRPRIEERKSIPRRAALDVKKSSKEKGKGKKSEGEQVKKDEELALILQESLNMVEPPPPPPNEEHKSISRRAAFDVQEQLAKEKGKGKQIEDEQVKKDEQLAVIVQESLNMVESPEEDSNISSSRAPMDEDEQRIIWESLKGKGLLTQPEDEVEDVGQLLEANPAPPPRCGGCYCEIEQERSVDVLGVLWHPECLICGACHNPITIHEVETHVSNLRGKFHKNCYRRYCYVCQEKVKIRMFNKHPFWKENYCPDHDSDGTHKCFSCERLEPKGTDFVELDDGRRLCLQCMDSAVMDTYEVQPLHFEIREFFEGLNMKIEREFPFLLVEKQALNKAEEEEKIDNQEDGVVTRGICLSEEQIVTSVSKGPKMGPNKQLIGKTTESQKVVSGCPVTAILILYGLPRLLTGYILAHEMMHAYLRLNGCRNLNNVMEEGICQVLGHMWLETQTYATIDAAASSAAPAPAAAESSSSSSRTPSEASAGKKGEWSEFEKKLVEFCKNQIETDESAAYGDGFRKVNHMVTNSSLKDTLKEILRRG